MEREREREVYRGIAEVVFPTNIIANVNVISSDNFFFLFLVLIKKLTHTFA